MFSPSDWPTTFGDDLHTSAFSNSSNKDKTEVDLVVESKRRMEQNMKQTNWELEMEKIKQQFMNSTPFKTRLTSDRISTYDGNTGREELQQAKMKVLSDFSQANFHKDSRQNLFKVEFDVYEFDPETVKVRLEDDTLVVEAKQLTQEGDTHRFKREFYRRVVVPSEANSDRMICKLSAAGILQVKIPAPPSYSEAFKDSKNNSEQQAGYIHKTQDGTQYTTDCSPSTPTVNVPSTTKYTPISTSPKRVTIRTREYVPEYTRSTSEHRPSTIEYTYSTKRSPVTRGYSTSTTEYVPSAPLCVSSTTRYTPSTVSKDYTPGISRKGTSFTGYSPTKYSTLPSRPKQRSSSSNRVYLGRSHANTIDSKWRTRQQKISLSDSLDSEATLSSSPSDDLYYGHSSFSDQDL